MRGKVFLAAFLLGVGLCFVPVSGYGEIKIWKEIPKVDFYMETFPDDPGKGLDEWQKACLATRPSSLDFFLLRAMVVYMMCNPTGFQNVNILYDSDGGFEECFPEGIDTKGKIYIGIWDSRGYFSDESGIRLLEAFKIYLEVIYGYINQVATDMDTDIVAKFVSKGYIPLGYFYQGEYHLWEK